MTRPDTLHTPPTLRELEARIGVGSLEEREAEMDRLIHDLAPLEAEVWGWEFQRTTLRSTLAMEYRAKLENEGKKATEALVEDLSRSDSRMVEAIAHIVTQKAKLTELTWELDKLKDRTRRENGLVYHDASLARL